MFSIRVEGSPRWTAIPGSTPGIALITLVVLKLTGVIAWSWWWVLSPMWISGLLLALTLGGLLYVIRCSARNVAPPVSADELRDWYGRFVAGTAHLDTPGGADGQGQGQASSPPDD
jgi:hypothetical protein